MLACAVFVSPLVLCAGSHTYPLGQASAKAADNAETDATAKEPATYPVATHRRFANGDKNTLTNIVTFVIKPEYEQAFLEQATQYQKMVQREEPGTILYILGKQRGQERTYVWVERYESEEAVDIHSKNPAMPKAIENIQKWLAEPPNFFMLDQVVPE